MNRSFVTGTRADCPICSSTATHVRAAEGRPECSARRGVDALVIGTDVLGEVRGKMREQGEEMGGFDD